jgi:ribosome-associated protein
MTKSAKLDIVKLQRAIVDGLEDVKAHDIRVFDTEAISPLFERVMVASGTSNRQTKAIAASVRDKVRDAGFPKPRIEGEANGEWIIVDCGAAVAHVMQPEFRRYYNLEEIWGEVPIDVAAEEKKAKAAVRKSAVRAQAEADAAESAKPAAKKAAAKKPAAKKTAAAKPAAKSAAAKKPAAKTAAKTVAKTATKTAAAKPVQTLVVGEKVKKPVAKKAAVKSAAKPAAKKAPVKSAAKPAAAKPAAKKPKA